MKLRTWLGLASFSLKGLFIHGVLAWAALAGEHGSRVQAPYLWLSRPSAREIPVPDLGSSPRPLRWKADSSPLDKQDVSCP